MAIPASKPTVPNPPRPTVDSQAFETALRGYDRRQVDEFIAAKDNQIAQLTGQLAEERRQRTLADERAEAASKKLRESTGRATATDTAPESGFGYRAEKLLRLAEQEATEVRAQASRESAAMIEKVRTEAEQHRHEVEQSLISRAAQLDQQMAQRSAELQEREQQIADQLTAARRQAEQLQADAVTAADRLRQEAEAAADQTRVAANREAQHQLGQANHEIARLTGLKSSVHAELARLAQLLAAELSNDSKPAVTPRHARPSRGAGAPAAGSDTPGGGTPPQPDTNGHA